MASTSATPAAPAAAPEAAPDQSGGLTCVAHEIAAMATQAALAQRCADVCCSGHGSCSADGGGACACDDSHHGAACELAGGDALRDCRPHAGSNFVEYGDHIYRTLDGTDPERTTVGCQGSSNYLALPPAFTVAPNDADSIAVTAAHAWGTHVLVVADGAGFWTSQGSTGETPGGRFRTGERLLSSDGRYTVGSCSMRVLARCP